MKTILLFILVAFSLSVNATQTIGVIKELYSSSTGSIALKLEGGFSSEAISECPTYNGFAGSSSADPILKSMLLAAFVSQQQVRLVINGCSGAWLNISGIYVVAN